VFELIEGLKFLDGFDRNNEEADEDDDDDDLENEEDSSEGEGEEGTPPLSHPSHPPPLTLMVLYMCTCLQRIVSLYQEYCENYTFILLSVTIYISYLSMYPKIITTIT